MIGEGRFLRLQRRAADPDARVLPLINIVFLLLIFFMITGHMSASSPFEMEPVQSAGAGQPRAEDLTVFMAADGRLAVSDSLVSARELETLVRTRVDAPAGGELKVRLQADGRTEATQVVAVMERLRAAGVERLELLTLPQR
jgi:biopolymer transport protein TolR